MKSPITGGEAILEQEQSETIYRGEKFSYIRYYYRCVDTGITFTDAETDERSLEQVYGQYRAKYGVPSPEKIKEIRSKYGLSSVAMAKILGIGENQYGLYENGEMPTKSIGRMIASMEDKNIFCFYLGLAKTQFSNKEYDKIMMKIEGTPTPVVYFYIDETYVELNRFVVKLQPAVYESNKKERWSKVRQTNTMALA